MYKTLLTFLALLSLCSCGGTRFAEHYAIQMTGILKTYRDQIDTKIEAERASYVELAKIHDAANVERVETAMAHERLKRAFEMSDRLVREREQSPVRTVAFTSQLHSDLERMAELDFQQSQAVLTRELDAYKRSMEGLADLTVEQENLDRLNTMLESLGNPKSIVERLKASGEFGCEVNRNLKLMDANHEIENLNAEIGKRPEAKAVLEKQKADVEALKTKLSVPCKVL